MFSNYTKNTSSFLPEVSSHYPIQLPKSLCLYMCIIFKKFPVTSKATHTKYLTITIKTKCRFPILQNLSQKNMVYENCIENHKYLLNLYFLSLLTYGTYPIYEYTFLSFPLLRLPVPYTRIPIHIFHKILYGL